MKTLIVAITCLGLGASISHAEDIAKEIGGMFKTPSKDETRAELQSNMDRMDKDQLQTLAVDYAHQTKVYQAQLAKVRESKQTLLEVIKDLRAEIKTLKAQ